MSSDTKQLCLCGEDSHHIVDKQEDCPCGKSIPVGVTLDINRSSAFSLTPEGQKYKNATIALGVVTGALLIGIIAVAILSCNTSRSGIKIGRKQ